uniref:Protein kinase cAMP-dependent X-linked catalytic subunit n=2 Tax=Rattus TaxID=10114 RepID=A0A0G2K247_RAT
MEPPACAEAAVKDPAARDHDPVDAKISAPAADPLPRTSSQKEGHSLQDWDTIATVGTGTFGRVNLVKEKTGRRYCALKIMSIPDVIRLKQEQHVQNEKAVLKEINHPFLIKLLWTDHDNRFLYMLMEFVPGGELFTYLRNRGRFSSVAAIFYATEIVCAIEYLHSKEIVYRDLKPENILLDREGHIKLTDFGFAKKLVDRTWTLCGTPEYLAPEVIQSKGHGRAVDWWALGILIFEMLSGFPPFFDDNPFGIYQKILACKIDFPRQLDFTSKDLIKKLLVVDRTRRLGNMKCVCFLSRMGQKTSSGTGGSEVWSGSPCHRGNLSHPLCPSYPVMVTSPTLRLIQRVSWTRLLLYLMKIWKHSKISEDENSCLQEVCEDIHTTLMTRTVLLLYPFLAVKLEGLVCVCGCVYASSCNVNTIHHPWDPASFQQLETCPVKISQKLLNCRFSPSS